jgi:hypothetical protein
MTDIERLRELLAKAMPLSSRSTVRDVKTAAFDSLDFIRDHGANLLADYERLRGMEERVKGAAVGKVTYINAMPPRRTPDVTVTLRLQDNLDPPMGQTVALVPVPGGE